MDWGGGKKRELEVLSTEEEEVAAEASNPPIDLHFWFGFKFYKEKFTARKRESVVVVRTSVRHV